MAGGFGKYIMNIGMLRLRYSSWEEHPNGRGVIDTNCEDDVFRFASNPEVLPGKYDNRFRGSMEMFNLSVMDRLPPI